MPTKSSDLSSPATKASMIRINSGHRALDGTSMVEGQGHLTISAATPGHWLPIETDALSRRWLTRFARRHRISLHQLLMTHSLVGYHNSGCGWWSRFQFCALRGG